MKLSVVLAAYRGEEYIAAQMRSVLEQLGPDDELIVSDDLPGGDTERIVRAFAREDARVVYLKGPGKGVCRNFEHALNAAHGDLLFLCDQDDIWLPGKVLAVTEAVAAGAELVLHDATVTDAALQPTHASYFAMHRSRRGFSANLLRNAYVGCCMAFSRSLLPVILPFPGNLPMHDWWIGLLGEIYGKVTWIEKPLILYRRHSQAVTGGHTSVGQKCLWRLRMASAVLSRKRELSKHRGEQ